MKMLRTNVETIFDSIWNNSWCNAVLLCVIPLSYLLLRQRKQPQRVSTAATTGAPLDSKIAEQSTVHPILTNEMKLKNITSRSRTNDDGNQFPNRITTTSEMKNDTVNTATSGTTTATAVESDTDGMDAWKCNCFSGQQFLPKSIFGNMEAVLKMGTGECYHK